MFNIKYFWSKPLKRDNCVILKKSNNNSIYSKIHLIAKTIICNIFCYFLKLCLGEEWKDMRSTLSPAFTSSKIKLMVPFMEEVGDQMIRALKKKIKDSDCMYEIYEFLIFYHKNQNLLAFLL